MNKKLNSENLIKNWATCIDILGKAILGLSLIAAIVLLCCDLEDLWWIALIVIGGGAVSMAAANFSAVMVWGFGDLVGDVRRISSCENATQVNDVDDLPEL